MASYPLIGKKTVYIDDMVISPDYVQDEAGTITLTPGTTEVSSQSGTINVPNGSYEEMSFELNIICPSVRYLGMLAVRDGSGAFRRHRMCFQHSA